MVHGVELADGEARAYRNRWIRTDDIARAMGEPPVSGPTPPLYDVSNTHVIGHAGRILALTEGAMPYELSPTLETLRRTDFGGPLPNGFTAHPKIDPVTGELHAFAYWFAEPYLTYLVIDANGTLVRSEPITLPRSVMMHDFAITREHVRLLRSAGGVRPRDAALPVPLGRRSPGASRRDAAVGWRRRRAVGRRRPLLRVPPDERVRRRRLGRRRRSAPPDDDEAQRGRPERRRRADARPVDHRSRGRQGPRGAHRRPGPGVPARERDPARLTPPLRVRGRAAEHGSGVRRRELLQARLRRRHRRGARLRRRSDPGRDGVRAE